MKKSQSKENEIILSWIFEFQLSMDIQMNMPKWEANVYDRSQEVVCLGDLDLESIILSVCIKTMTLGGIFKR